MSTAAPFDFAPLLPAGLPAPAARWTGLAKYSFVGGNNDPDQVPVDGLIDAVNAVLRREGKTLATYGLASGPQGYRPLREFLTAKLKRDAGIDCAADDIMIVSGSLQALDLVNQTLLARGDTVLIEQETYQGVAEPADAAWRQRGRHSPRRRRHADGRAGGGAGRPQAPRHHAEIYLHDPDRAEPDRHHHAGDAPRRDAKAVAAIWRADFRGRLLRRPDLERTAAARDLRDEQEQQRHPYRLVLQIDRAGAAGRLHRRALGDDVADAGAEDRRRLRRAGADGAGGILRAAFLIPCAETDARPARQARHADGSAQRAVRHRGRIRGPQGRHLPVGQTARQCRYAKALSGGAGRRRRHQSRARNGRPTRPMPAAGCGCALPAPRTSRSARASPCSPTSAARSSACPPRSANVEKRAQARPDGIASQSVPGIIFDRISGMAGALRSIAEGSCSSSRPRSPGARRRSSHGCFRSIPGPSCSGEGCSAAA